MTFECKKGTFHWEYFNRTKSSNLNRLLLKRNFRSKKEAIKYGIKQWERKKWIQGTLVYVENIISHKEVAYLTTKGVIHSTYSGKGYKVLARAKNYDKSSVF